MGVEAGKGLVIAHDPQARRFVATLDGQQGQVDYERDNQALTITHTLVPSAIGGRGVAAALVRAAAEFARSAGLGIVPACSYADAWLRRNPEFADLRVPR